MSLNAIVVTAVLTLAALLVTSLYRALARTGRAVLAHLAQLARLPDALDEFRKAAAAWRSDHEQRITHLERLNGVTP